MRQSSSGFSLIELLIVVGIVGILSALVFQSTGNSSEKTNRAVVKTVLLEIQGKQERYQINEHKYASLADLSYSSPLYINKNGDSAPQAKAIYKITINLPTDFTYTLTAEPINQQAGDSCGSLTITEKSAKSAAKTDCW